MEFSDAPTEIVQVLTYLGVRCICMYTCTCTCTYIVVYGILGYTNRNCSSSYLKVYTIHIIHTIYTHIYIYIRTHTHIYTVQSYEDTVSGKHSYIYIYIHIYICTHTHIHTVQSYKDTVPGRLMKYCLLLMCLIHIQAYSYQH